MWSCSSCIRHRKTRYVCICASLHPRKYKVTINFPTRVCLPGERILSLYVTTVLPYIKQVDSSSHRLTLFLFTQPSCTRTDQIEKYTIYPYVHSFSNVPNRQAMLRAIRIPDVLPSDLPSGANFSLVAGAYKHISLV